MADSCDEKIDTLDLILQKLVDLELQITHINSKVTNLEYEVSTIKGQTTKMDGHVNFV